MEIGIHDELMEIQKQVSSIEGKMDLFKECQSDLKELSRCVSSIKVDVGQLKIKAGVWGAIGASIPIAVMIVAQVLIYYIK